MNALAVAKHTSPPVSVGLRLEIFATVPGWAIAHGVSDNSCAPLFREGEVAIVESDGHTGWYPEEGALFLIEYLSPAAHKHDRPRRSCRIVQTCLSTRGDGTWYAHPYCRPQSEDDREAHMERTRTFYCSDGPYAFDALADKLIGRVIGIYQPEWRVH